MQRFLEGNGRLAEKFAKIRKKFAEFAKHFFFFFGISRILWGDGGGGRMMKKSLKSIDENDDFSCD